MEKVIKLNKHLFLVIILLLIIVCIISIITSPAKGQFRGEEAKKHCDGWGDIKRSDLPVGCLDYFGLN